MAKKTIPDEGEEVVILSPCRQFVEIDGRLLYNEGLQAWNTIRFKKDVLKEFPQLTEKTGSFSYKMIIHRNSEDAKRALEMIDENNVPIFLFLCKEKNIK